MDDPATYFDESAATYDATLAAGEQPWTGADIEFYRALARDADGPALEIGVGTGRVYLPLRRDGLDVDGIDVSPGMLDRLRERAGDGLDVSVRVGDVTDLDPDREYGLVYCPARAFNHLADLVAQRAAMRQVHDALAPGGRFALNTFAPDPQFVADRYTVRDVTELDDAVEWVATMRREVYDADGALVTETATPLALVTKREFELLFADAGFSDWSFHGDFEGEPLESTAQELVAVAER
jgi:SAM-dependent methyltransferase